MPNIATVLKDEIARVARKEVRGELLKLKKASAQYRSEIAALKRRAQSLEQQLGRLGRGTAKKAEAATPDEPAGTALRFSAKGLAKQRQRLGISAASAAALMGVSALSVYKWESGSTRPRASQLPAIASLRKLSKSQAAARLAELAA